MEEEICKRETRVTKENWQELVDLSLRHRDLKIYVPIMDRDDTFMVMDDGEFYVSTSDPVIEQEYVSTAFSSEEARELSGFTI